MVLVLTVIPLIWVNFTCDMCVVRCYTDVWFSQAGLKALRPDSVLEERLS